MAAEPMRAHLGKGRSIPSLTRMVGPAMALTLTVSGCVESRGWMYSVTPPVERPTVSTHTVVVLPLIDERPDENSNKVWVYWIPLMPFGWQDLNVPERQSHHINSNRWQFNPPEDLAAALAGEISNSRIFREAVFASDPSRGDLILQGRLSSLRYHSRLYSYGLSIVGPLLWLVGLPMSSVDNTLTFSLKLEDRVSHTVVWEQAYSTEHRERTVSLYNLPEDFSYDEMLKELLPKILTDLEQAVRQGQKLSGRNHSPRVVAP